MGSEHNRTRRKWQGLGGTNANTAEKAFFDCFSKAFVGTNYDIIEKPKEFRSIYVDFPLDTKTLSEIYTPDTPVALHGILPDYAITNRVTGKTIYIEVKRQDGWVWIVGAIRRTRKRARKIMQIFYAGTPKDTERTWKN